MSSPALALTPVPPGSGTGGSDHRDRPANNHRHHVPRENTDGNWRTGNRGASRVLQWPGVPCFPLSFHRRAAASIRLGHA
jgi:hypothetical protein